MKNKYRDLIQQTFHFPQEGFNVVDGELHFNDVPLMDIIKQYGTPLKITYIPKIGQQIQKAKKLFNVAMAKADYKGNYTYCYCTKSSHFSFVMDEAIKNGSHLETSSAFDIPIIKELYRQGKIDKNTFVICNGYKRKPYPQFIVELINNGYKNVIPILDNKNELEYYKRYVKGKCKLGLRIASEEEPTYDYYTSRLGIRYKEIVPFYKERIKGDKKLELKMLHFFVSAGIKDTIYYWTELAKCLNVYAELKRLLSGTGFSQHWRWITYPHLTGFEYDYEYIIEEIVSQIKTFCKQNKIKEPNIFTEFGSFSVGESGAALYSVCDQKQQNDRELWYMIDSSFITTLPDTWAIGQKFILLAVNHWEKESQRVNLGGMTCDGLDYYNTEAHSEQVFLPKIGHGADGPLYIGFFHTGAYQESISGYGGIQHCLIPAPKHVLIDRDENGKITTKLFAKEQTYKSMLKTLGY